MSTKAWKEANKEKISLANKTYRKNNKEKLAAYSKTWRENNKEKVSLDNKAWRIANKETQRAKNKAWSESNKENKKAQRKANKEKIAAQAKAYRKAHPEVFRAIDTKRRAAKLQQTPPWYTHTDCVAIYKELKPGYHLDHIIPLQGENVSGLHWHHNLQLLPAAENIAKSNKFNPDTYMHELPIY